MIRSSASGSFIVAFAPAAAMLLLIACASESEQEASEQAKAADQSVATAAAPAFGNTLTHYSGVDTVPTNPETVVVFDLGVLISLNDLGIEVDAAGGLGIPMPEEYDAIVNNPDYPDVGSAAV